MTDLKRKKASHVGRGLDRVQPYEGKKAVVVGAGPSGTLSAIYLASEGFTVDIYERDSSPVAERETLGPRSYSILLSRRGVEAMMRAGVELPQGSFLASPESLRYSPGSTKATPGMPSNQWSKVIGRGALARCMVSEAQRLHPTKIRFHFGFEIRSFDLRSMTATFSSLASKEEPAPVHYDVLIGADGAGSRVRQLLGQQLTGFSFSQLADSMEYKMVELPSLEHVDPKWRSHITTMSNPKRSATLIALPEAAAEGEAAAPRAVIILPKGTFDRLGRAEECEAAIRESFTVFREDQYPVLAAQLVASPISGGGSNTRCSQLWGPGVVMMGDAAHSVWPSLGQGANAALESAGVLGKVLEECQGAVLSVPLCFHEARHADALAVVDLTQRYSGRKVRAGVVGPSSLLSFTMLKLIGQFVLSKLLPWLVPKPALFEINGTLMRYSEIQGSMQRHSRIADIVSIATLAAIVLALMQAFIT